MRDDESDSKNHGDGQIVETDFDDAALMGLSPRTAAPLETRIRIVIDSDASPEGVRDLTGRALSTDPWFLALRDAQVVRHTIVQSRPA